MVPRFDQQEPPDWRAAQTLIGNAHEGRFGEEIERRFSLAFEQLRSCESVLSPLGIDSLQMSERPLGEANTEPAHSCRAARKVASAS